MHVHTSESMWRPACGRGLSFHLVGLRQPVQVVSLQVGPLVDEPSGLLWPSYLKISYLVLPVESNIFHFLFLPLPLIWNPL